MAESPSVEKIASLKAGEISELVMEQNEFSQSRDARISLPDRTEIVGEAGLNGRVTCRYQKKEEQSVQNITKFKRKVLCKVEKNGNLRN